MNKNRRYPINCLMIVTIILLCITVTAQSQDTTKHALVIGIDGALFDAVIEADTPNLDSIKVNGTWTHSAFAGGVLGTPTQQVTSSGPSWSTILTGVWKDKHGVGDNSFNGSRFDEYPCFFKRIKEYKPTADLASIINWTPINTYIVSDADLEERYEDEPVATRVAELLTTENPDVIFVHFDGLDGVGHSSGYSPSNPAYVAYIETLDGYIGVMLNAMRSRAKYWKEDWLVLVTTDHGGLGTGHGGQSLEERTVFIYKSSLESKMGELSDPVGLTAVPPTVLEHLEIPINPEWGWEEEPFGIPKQRASNYFPQNGATDIPVNTILSWKPGVNAVSHNVYFGTDSNLDDDFKINQTDTLYNPGVLTERATYYWRIDEVSNVDTVKGAVQNFTTLSTTQYSTGHWTFDSTLHDETGNITGVFSGGSPVYVDGVLGKAVHLDGVDDHIILGYAFDLNYGEETDFSVSIWVKSDGWSSDPSIISNKDWASGSNTGWIIACGSGSNTWQWNYAGKNNQRRDYDPSTPVLNDGNWHHLCVTHDRDGQAKFYFDGELEASIDISISPGSIDSGFPTVIGNDGTQAYSPSFSGYIDEVNIFNRALNQSEINDLYLVTAIEEGLGVKIPRSNFLANNYPNPFNATTIIRYEVEANNNINLSVYDLMGQKVKTLVSENQNAGEYSILFDASDLASGIYIYKLKAGLFEQSRKMLLLR